MSEGFPSESGLDDGESLDVDALLHLGEVGFAGGPITVTAYMPQVGVPPEAFDEVLDVGYLLELSERQGPEIPLGLVFYWSSWAVFVEVCPEDGVDGG